MFDDKYLKEVMQGVLGTPSITYYEARKAYFKLTKAKADAESLQSMDLSHDRVKGGTPMDMTDNVSRILDAEATYDAAKTRYFASIMSLRHYLARARQLNLMTKTQARLWLKYYIKGKGSITYKALANSEGMTADQVFDRIQRKQAKQIFLDAVKSVIEDAEWDDPQLNDAVADEQSMLVFNEPSVTVHVDYNNQPIIYNYELNNPNRVN